MRQYNTGRCGKTPLLLYTGHPQGRARGIILDIDTTDNSRAQAVLETLTIPTDNKDMKLKAGMPADVVIDT